MESFKLKFYIRSAIIALVIVFVLCLGSQGATVAEKYTATTDGLRVCKQYNPGCSIKTDNRDDLIGAFTKYNTITIHRGLANLMTEDELRSVIYHEVAHAILRHSERGVVLIQQYNLNQVTFKPIRLMFEEDADKLACYLLYLDNQVNALDSALYKIHTVNGTNTLNEDYKTHPVAANRIKMIQIYKGVYGN